MHTRVGITHTRVHAPCTRTSPTLRLPPPIAGSSPPPPPPRPAPPPAPLRVLATVGSRTREGTRGAVFGAAAAAALLFVAAASLPLSPAPSALGAASLGGACCC
eukprot:3179144-Rhodomonas_salina.1